MTPENFAKLITDLEGLDEAQQAALLARVQVLQGEATSARLIHERLGPAVACVHCGSTAIWRFGQVRGQQRYRCKDCLKTFMPLTKTPVQHLHDRGKWVAHAHCMQQGMTLRQTARAVGISLGRAFRWRHRFLKFLAQQSPEGLTGVVEADEAFFTRSFKGQRKDLPRPAKKRGGAAKKGDLVPVLMAMQRGTRLAINRVLKDRSADELTAALEPAVASDAVLSTDGNPSYRVVAANLNLQAGRFVASFDGHGGDGVWHVQNVNAYDSRLRQWMYRFRGVATKYLHHYLGWRRLIDRFGDEMTGPQFLFHALRPTYVNTV